MTIRKMESRASAVVIEATLEDWDEAPPELLEDMLVKMVAVRSFEQALLDLAREGLVHGPMHSSIGQEGAAVGSILALRPGDGVNGTHRGHHQFIAKALHDLRPDGMNLIDGVKGDELEEFFYRMGRPRV